MKKNKDSSNPFKEKGCLSVQNADLMPPTFSFERMIDGNGFSVACCENEEKISLLNKLYHLRQMTWREILQAHRHGSGSEKIERSAIKATLPTSITDDTTLIAIRYNGKKPIVGYRDGRIFYILYIDSRFSLYNHG